MNSNFGDRPGARSRGLRAIVFAAIVAAISLNGTTSGADASLSPPLDATVDAAPWGTPTAEDIATMLNVRFHIGLQDALKIGQAVLNAARRDTISSVLLLAVIAVESNFDRFAMSVVDAEGLMQVLPSQHKDLVLRTADLADAGTNVNIGSGFANFPVEYFHISSIIEIWKRNGLSPRCRRSRTSQGSLSFVPWCKRDRKACPQARSLRCWMWRRHRSLST